MEDIVRITRVIVYEGPRSVVENQVKNSVHGTKTLGSKGSVNDSLTITAVTLDTFPVVVTPAAIIRAAYNQGLEEGRKAVADAKADAHE